MQLTLRQGLAYLAVTRQAEWCELNQVEFFSKSAGSALMSDRRRGRCEGLCRNGGFEGEMRPWFRSRVAGIWQVTWESIWPWAKVRNDEMDSQGGL